MTEKWITTFINNDTLYLMTEKEFKLAKEVHDFTEPQLLKFTKNVRPATINDDKMYDIPDEYIKKFDLDDSIIVRFGDTFVELIGRKAFLKSDHADPAEWHPGTVLQFLP